MSETALRFSGVAKSCGRTLILHGVSLEIRRGEFFGLVGANGAGKTTLLKCLLDFCDAEGDIEIFGASHRLSAARRRLAFDRREKTGPDSVREDVNFLLLERIMRCPRECV
jgi:ABC-2 type transport system ATP-binding protein